MAENSKENEQALNIEQGNDAIVDAPIPFDFQDAEGKDHVLMLVRHGPIETCGMSRWINEVFRKDHAPVLPFSREELALFDKEERKIILSRFAEQRASAQHSTAITPSFAEAMAIIATPAGYARMIWYSAQANHKDLPLAFFEKAITEENLPGIARRYEAALAAKVRGIGDPK